MSTTSPAAVRYFHGGTGGLEPGTRLTPLNLRTADDPIRRARLNAEVRGGGNPGLSFIDRNWVYVSTWPDFCHLYARSVANTSNADAAIYEVAVDPTALSPDPDSSCCPGDGLAFRVAQAEVVRTVRVVPSSNSYPASVWEAWRCTARHDDMSLVVHPRYDRLAAVGTQRATGDLMPGPALWARMRNGGCTTLDF